MKKRTLLLLAVCTMLLTSCGQSNTTAKSAPDSTETPVIILGDEAAEETEQSVEEEPLTTQETIVDAVESQNGKTEIDHIEGMYLVIGNAPKSATVIDTKSYSDGTYFENLSCEDDTVFIHMERENLTGPDISIESTMYRFMEEKGWNEGVISTMDEELANQVGFPVYRYQFSTGEGEETNVHDAVYIPAGQYGFLLDCYSEASTYEENLDLMELWITSSYIDGIPATESENEAAE